MNESMQKRRVYLIIFMFVCAVIVYNLRLLHDRTALDGPYDVIRVIDGDTILVRANGEEIRVRLIGIDAPESVNPDETKNTPEGEAASEWLKSILPVSSMVYLEYDVERYDKYGRTLAYVYLDDAETMLNRLILENGYAKVMTIEPNDKYAGEFERVAENE